MQPLSVQASARCVWRCVWFVQLVAGACGTARVCTAEMGGINGEQVIVGTWLAWLAWVVGAASAVQGVDVVVTVSLHSCVTVVVL